MRHGTESWGFLDAIDLPVRVIRGRFRALYAVALTVSLIAVVPGALLQFLSDPSNPYGFPAGPLLTAYLALFVASVLLTIFAQLAVYEAVRRTLDDEPVSLGACVAQGLRPSAILALIVSGVLAMLGIFCLCVPGIVVGIGLAFLMPAIVERETGAFESLPRSWELVYYKAFDFASSPMWIRIVGVGLAAYLLQGALTSISSVPAMIAGFFFTLREATTGAAGDPQAVLDRLVWVQVVVTVLGAFVSAIGSLYVASAFTLLYRRAREERDAPMLEAALDARLAAAAREPS